MLRSVKSLHGAKIQATDGEIGSVKDFLFDDDRWTVRYLVVRTGNWLSRKAVLIPPFSVKEFAAAPVNREYEEGLYDYYGRPAYWAQESGRDLEDSIKHAGHFRL